MVFLYILLGLGLLVGLILSLKVHIYINYEKELTVDIRLLWLKDRIIPDEDEDKKYLLYNKNKSINKKTNQEYQSSLEQVYYEEGLKGLVSLLKDALEILARFFSEILEHIFIRKFDVDINVAGDDCADTAVYYGQVCSVVYPIVSAIARVTICKRYDVNIVPDFSDNPEGKAKCCIKADVRVIWVIKTLFVSAYKIAKYKVS